MQPVLDYSPTAKQPVVVAVPQKTWTFSFKHWRQIENFGLDNVPNPNSWFVSLIEKLRELSMLDVEKFVATGTTRDAWRYHKINWNQTNIPVQRKDFNWIEKDVLDNEDEFPFVQFQVSTSLGRVVGYWAPNGVFEVLLLDPLHNIQPSKRFGYKVDHCSPINCDYTSLLIDIDTLKKGQYCSSPECGYKYQITKLPSKANYSNVLMHYVSDETLFEIDKLMRAGAAKDESEILEYGIMFLNSI